MSQGFAITPSMGNNLLINGGFNYFQRISSPSTLTSFSDDTYGPDRWNVLTQTASVQVARISGNGTQYAGELKQNQASAQRMGMEQIVEGVNSVTLRGQYVRLQGQFRCSSAQAIRFAILEWTGTTDSVTSDIVNDWTSSTYSASNFFIASITVTAIGSITPTANAWTDFSIAGTVSSSCTNAIAFIWTEGTAAQNVTLDVGRMDMFVGGTTRPWNPRPRGEDFDLCQRYFQSVWNGTAVIGYGQVVATNTISWILYPPVLFRTTPVLAVSATNDFNGNDGSNVQSNGISIASSIGGTEGTGTLRMSITQAGTTWTVARCAAVFGHSSSSYMWFDAEL